MIAKIGGKQKLSPILSLKFVQVDSKNVDLVLMELVRMNKNVVSSDLQRNLMQKT